MDILIKEIEQLTNLNEIKLKAHLECCNLENGTCSNALCVILKPILEHYKKCQCLTCEKCSLLRLNKLKINEKELYDSPLKSLHDLYSLKESVYKESVNNVNKVEYQISGVNDKYYLDKKMFCNVCNKIGSLYFKNPCL